MTRGLPSALAALAVSMSLSLPAVAEEPYMRPVRDFVLAKVAPWSRDPALVAGILAQNAAHARLTAEGIRALDERWQAAFDGGEPRVAEDVLRNAVSRLLKARQAESGGVILEAFVMDNRGLIVGASEATSDYWQGDEAKFQKSFDAGAGAIFIDVVEKDDSTQRLMSQASLTISDDSGRPIGAITVGIDLEAL